MVSKREIMDWVDQLDEDLCLAFERITELDDIVKILVEEALEKLDKEIEKEPKVKKAKK